MSVARRERKYGGPDSDRTKRALSQPVHAWERKWTDSARGSHIQVCKWVKSDREIEFEDDEEDEEEEEDEEMDAEKELPASDDLDTSNAAPTDASRSEAESNADVQPPELPVSTGLLNSAVNKKLEQIEDEEHTHTPKLDDVSDHEPEPETTTDAEKDNPAAYPASNPHIQVRLEETDSLGTTPQETQDEEMEDASGLDTFESSTATPEYTHFRSDRAREVLDAALSAGSSMEPSLSRSSMNDETPASSGPFDEE